MTTRYAITTPEWSATCTVNQRNVIIATSPRLALWHGGLWSVLHRVLRGVWRQHVRVEVVEPHAQEGASAHG